MSRKRLDVAEEALAKYALDVKERDRLLSKHGHEWRKKLDEAALLLRDLRLVTFRLEDSRDHERLIVSMEIASTQIYQAYRRDHVFRELLGHMLEQEIERSEVGRRLLTARPW